jgi:ribose-phosphate pyrophosphokinase
LLKIFETNFPVQSNKTIIMSHFHLDLTYGIATTEQYKAFKFPGGEIHFKLSEETTKELTNLPAPQDIFITTRPTSAESFLLLIIALETLCKDFRNDVLVYLPYMPYQQADRDFSVGECFSLKTITKILNMMPPQVSYVIFDPHSDVAPALLDNGVIETNEDFIKDVLTNIDNMSQTSTKEYKLSEQLVVLSPDAGAYKKIYKLCDAIGFNGQIESANKYRDTETGDLEVRLSLDDFEGKDVLIIDDICMGGRTFIELAKLLHRRNVRNVYLAISHGVFSNGFEELSGLFTGIFTTNSYRSTDDFQDLPGYEMLHHNICELNVFEVI